MRIPFLLTIHALFFCSSAVASSEDPNRNNRSNIRTVRKRIDEYGEIMNEDKNDVEIGRQYLESLWDSVEKKHDRKLQRGRLPYLESMMSMLPMSMSLQTTAPTKQNILTKGPNNSPPVIPGRPTKVPSENMPIATKTPTLPTIADPAKPTAEPLTPSSPTAPPIGPTLPTREPIPTKAPIPAPSTGEPAEAPTTPIPPTATGPLTPTRPCIEAEKEIFLLEVLLQTTEKSKLLDVDTPQGMAYSFLLEEEPSFVCTQTLLQRYGLTTFYFAMGGTTWTNSGGWLGHTQECDWYGVNCNDGILSTSLNLAVNNLSGMIPDEISVLSTLQKLDLFFNSITGTLPGGLADLESLTALDLQQNLLVGRAFPISVTSLSQLVSYRISNNQLSGEIPTQISSLRNLKELWAGDNKILGSIPSEIGDLRDLKTIYFDNNDLTGKVPSELGLITLEGLVMNDNNFLGTIPSQLFNVASLNTIRLDGNFLVGNLPDSIGQLTDLENFRVEHNNLSGQIPESIGFMTSLVNLRLNDNFWNGTVPDVFENYKQLDFFDISNSNLAGSIPKSIFSIPTLRLAYMSNCALGGTIPSEYADPPDLRDLYLDGNKFTGVIPPIVPGQLEKLSEFLLQDNNISGAMPESICSLRSDFILDDLWTDCSGESPEIECDFPECCNRCFETETLSPTRKKKRELKAEHLKYA